MPTPVATAGRRGAHTGTRVAFRRKRRTALHRGGSDRPHSNSQAANPRVDCSTKPIQVNSAQRGAVSVQGSPFDAGATDPRSTPDSKTGGLQPQWWEGDGRVALGCSGMQLQRGHF